MMRARTCTACRRTFDEADRRWDEARYTGQCPFCGATRSLIDEPPDRPVPGKYRTSGRRILAGVIDAVLLLPLAWANSWMFAHVAVIPILALWYVLFSISLVAYSVLGHGRYGRTVGKALVGVVVRDVSEGPLSIRQAVLRDIVPLVFLPIDLAYELPDVAQGLDDSMISSPGRSSSEKRDLPRIDTSGRLRLAPRPGEDKTHILIQSG